MARRVAPPRTSGVHTSFPSWRDELLPTVISAFQSSRSANRHRAAAHSPSLTMPRASADVVRAVAQARAHRGRWLLGLSRRDVGAGERAAVGSRGPRTARSRTPPRGLAAIPQLFEHRHLDPHDHGGPQFEGCGLKYRWLEGVSSITNSSVTFPGSVNLRGRELQDVTERVRYPVQRSERYVRLRRCESIVRGGGV